MKYPPLSVWLIVTILLVFSLSLIHQSKNKISQYFLREPIDLAFHKTTPHDKEIKVVILCSSHGNTGISDPLILKRLMKQKFGLNFDFVKLSKPRSTLEDFTTNPLLIDKMIAYAPDYIIIQESQLLFEPETDESLIQSIGLYKIELAHYLRKNIFKKERRAINKVNENPNKRYIPTVDSTNAESKKLRTKQLKKNHKTWSNFRSQFEAKIIAVTIPIAKHLEIELQQLRNSTEFKDVMRQKKQTGSFDYFNFQQTLPCKYFSDMGHLNENGQKVYTDWLLTEIHHYHMSKNEKN